MLSDERVLAQIHAYAATVPGSSFARLEEYIRRIFAENAALRERLAAAERDLKTCRESRDYEMDVSTRGLETLQDRLAAAEQREQQARAIILQIAVYRGVAASHLHTLEKQARAWLADRAEQAAQRAATQEEE